MPQGKHKGVRVALSVPEGIYNQLDQWAEAEGRAIASLCMSLVEQGLKQAVIDGIAPSVMQTKENDPYLNTKPGVTAHRMSPEEIQEMESSGKFHRVTPEMIERNKQILKKDAYQDLSENDKRQIMQELLKSMGQG